MKESIKNFRTLLEAKGLKQVDLVRHLGVDPSRASLFVNGVILIPDKYHKVIAEFFGISASEFKKINSKGRNK